MASKAANSGAMQDRTTREIVSYLRMPPNTDEKGYLSQTFRDISTGGGRGASTAAYYLLDGTAGSSVWHRLDAAEVWHYYAGATLTLSIWADESGMRHETLGPDIFAGQRPQIVVRKGEWQSASSEGAWTLCGTTVAPGFVDSCIEFAEPGWVPPGN